MENTKMELDNQEMQSDVQSPEGSAGTPDSESSSQSQQPAATQEASQPESQVPFHEHPRFRELIDQKNKMAEEVQSYQRSMSEMQQMVRELQQRAQQPKQEDALIARLKQIDPEFGSRFEELNSAKEEIRAFREWQQDMQMQTYRHQAETSLSSLYDQHKVPENFRERYKNEINAIAAANPDLRVSDLPKVFKHVHDGYTKFVEELRRQERASYVGDKNAGKTPSTVSGGAAPSAKSEAQSMTKEDAVNEIVRQMRASKQKI
jgi:DNA repair exonuclease SbcCD ATPase subunit